MTWLTWRRIGILVAIAFVAGLIRFLPASVFEARINETLPAPWNAAMAGTLWDGEGVLRAGKSPDSLRIPLTWTFDATALLRLNAAWDVASTSRAIAGTVNLGKTWGALELRNAALTLDTAALAPLYPPLALAAPSGILQVSTPTGAAFVVRTGDALRMTGDLQVEATRFSIRPLSANLSGDYTAKLAAQDSRIGYTLRQRKGALDLDGTGTLDMASRSLSYAGLVTTAPELPEAVLSQLKSLGKAEPNGRLRLDWETQW